MPSNLEPTQAALDTIASSYPHDPKYRYIVDPQFVHRLHLCKAWGIASGSKVLDVGCGQGDAAVVLAYAVGPEGHVTGIDPGPPDYGSPLTLSQAQGLILKSELGQRMAFHHSDGPAFLASYAGAPFDAVTLCHSLWYFDTQADVLDLFAALAAAARLSKVRRVCVAEYTGTASNEVQVPHELSAKVQALFHRAKKSHATAESSAQSTANVRDALPPAEIIELARQAGFNVVSTGTLPAPTGLLDGSWEVQAATSAEFAQEVRAAGLVEETEIMDYVSDIQNRVQLLKAEGTPVQTMDIAWVVLELAK